MKKFAGVSTIALAAAMVATGVQAADAPPAPADVSAVIVTGTRVTGVKAADSAAPIQVVGADALKRVGQPDLMQALSQTLPSFNAQGYGADTAALTLSAALRGLNPNDTLVLVNGKRRHTTANLAVDTGSAYQGAATTDLSFIPVGAIDHIEVLPSSASATAAMPPRSGSRATQRLGQSTVAATPRWLACRALGPSWKRRRSTAASAAPGSTTVLACTWWSYWRYTQRLLAMVGSSSSSSSTSPQL